MSDKGAENEESVSGTPAGAQTVDARLSDLEDRLATSEAHLIALENELRHSAGVLKQVRRDLRTVTDTHQDRDEAFAAQTERIHLLTLVLHEAEQSIRREVSQRLHEDLRQILYGAQVQLRTVLDNLEQAPSWEGKGALLDETRWLEEVVERAIGTTRGLSMSLAPPLSPDATLSEMVAPLKQLMSELYNLEVEIKIDGDVSYLGKSLNTLIYHLLRIFLINVATHAETDRAEAEIVVKGDQIVAHVQDRGKGFDIRLLEEESYLRRTINNVRRRLEAAGGGLDVDSIPGDGTRVTATLPFTIEP